MIELGPIIASVLRSIVAYFLGTAAASAHDSLITQIATGIGVAIVASLGARNAIINSKEKAALKTENDGPESDHK